MVTQTSQKSLSTILTASEVHADASNFASGVSKKEAYEQVLEQARALFDGQRNWVSHMHEPDRSKDSR